MKLMLAVIGSAVLAGCQSFPMMSSGTQARAALESRSNSSAGGTVTFGQRGEKMTVSVKATGLKPNSEHGFHVHEKGDCSAPDAMSAGGHFNPEGAPHGHHGQAKRHAGDMKNLMADGKGEATVSFEVTGMRLDDGKQGILNRAVVIHANPDDYTSQPAGNSGGRIACGIIRKS